MTVPFLQRLARRLQCAPDRGMPSSLAGMLELLISHCLPNVGADCIQSIIAQRTKSPIRYEGCLTEAEITDMYDQEVIDEDEKGVAQEMLKKIRASKDFKPKAPIIEKAGSPPLAASSSQPSASSGGGGNPGGAKPAKQKHFSGYHTPSEVKLLLPSRKGCSIAKDDVRFNRWTVMCPCPQPPKSFSRSWGDGAIFSEQQCLKSCYDWVWARHEELTQEVCPYIFEIGADGGLSATLRADRPEALV